MSIFEPLLGISLRLTFLIPIDFFRGIQWRTQFFSGGTLFQDIDQRYVFFLIEHPVDFSII